MFRLKPTTGPSVSLFKLNSKQIVDFVKPAIFYSSLAMFVLELECDNSIGSNGYIDFKAGPG